MKDTSIRKRNSRSKEVWRRLKKNKAAVVGLIIIVFFILTAIMADVIIPYSMATKQNSQIRLQPPSAEYIFGTDAAGRDLFARVVHGSRVSLVVGFGATFMALLLGGALGAIAGYYGGWRDTVIMRIMDVLMSIPSVLLALTIVAVLGSDMVNLLIAITVSSIPKFARVSRVSVMSVVGKEYIEAAPACSTSNRRIIIKHVLPNAMGPIIVQATMSVAVMILVAAALSFIGMGVQPPQPEWGALLSEAREYIRTSSYLLFFPGCAIVLAALSINLLGDGLRDALDPHLKN